MIKVSEPTIKDKFEQAILQNSISDETPERQAEIVLSRIRLALSQGYSTSPDETGKVWFELGKASLDNSYISRLPLSLIKAALHTTAEDAGISSDEIEGMMIVKQTVFSEIRS